MRIHVFLAATVLVVSACGSDDSSPRPRTNIALSSFDTSCKASSDCKAVGVGSFCPCAPCANAAINAKDESKYDSQVSRIQCPVGGKCGACPAPPAVDCVDGGCLVQ